MGLGLQQSEEPFIHLLQKTPLLPRHGFGGYPLLAVLHAGVSVGWDQGHALPELHLAGDLGRESG